MGGRFSSRIAGWVGGLALAVAGPALAAGPDLSRMDAAELAAFAHAMPKGGELHNHLSGGIFSETLLGWAAEDGLCVDVRTLALVPPCQPGEDLKPARALAADEPLRQAMMDSLSVRHPGFRDRSGHDQFFTAFGRYGATNPRRDGEMLAETLNGLARQNTFYLEAMVTPQSFASRAKGAEAGWKGGDLAAQAAADTAAGLDALVPAAIANYRLHMRMVDFLTDHGRRTPVALHAGELSLKYATPQELSYHVAEAVRVAGARRIGHGTDLPLEQGAEALAAEMAARGVLVEVNLTSNAAILEVSGKDHPYGWLRRRGVPVSLSTDDAGILRIDLSHEYARAATEGAGYEDLKRSARNAIAFSFLSGAGLWEDPGTYRRPARACAGQIGAETPRPGPCAELVAGSDKAREQWRHERLLKSFEAGLVRPGG